MGGILLFLVLNFWQAQQTTPTKLQVSTSLQSANNGRTDYEPRYPSNHHSRRQFYQENHYLQYQHLYGDDNLADGIIEGEGWVEDEGWWDGVEEIDLTQKPPQYLDETQLYLIPLNNEMDQRPNDLQSFRNCGDDESMCDVEVFPPPPKLDMPPPPIPPFMPGLINMIRRESLELFIGVPPQSHCSLCQWAEEGNSSITSFVEETAEGGNGGPDGGSVAGLVAGVAVGSAVTGAVLMAVLIRCRRAKILPSGRDSCPVLPRTSWTKPSSGVQGGRPEVPKPVTVAATSTNPSATEGDTTSRTGWAMKLWRRGSAQERPLRPSSAYSSENSYTEEPYVHPDAQSSVYAELAQGLNTYSEIPDPGGPDPGGLLQHKLVVSDYGYGNSAYALSEAPSEPAESSSTPSSAYYSDVSTDARASKKKRKKKKGNDREAVMMSNCNFGGGVNMPVNISSTVPIISARIGDNMVPLSHEELCVVSSSHDVVPLSLRFLPHSYSLERQGVAYACAPCQSCTPISTLPIIRHPCELPTMVLNPNNSHSHVTHILPHANEPAVQFAVRTTAASEMVHDVRSRGAPAGGNTIARGAPAGGNIIARGAPAGGNTIARGAPAGGNTIPPCSPLHLHRSPMHNQAMMHRQEHPLPFPPTEYV